MEATQYAELKSTRDAARSAVSKMGRVVRNLKSAMYDLGSGSPLYVEVESIRETLKVEYGHLKVARDDLNAQVTAAREEYRKEHPKFVPAPTVPEDDEDDEDDYYGDEDDYNY